MFSCAGRATFFGGMLAVVLALEEFDNVSANYGHQNLEVVVCAANFKRPNRR
jgi:hypothetical protein